MGNQQPGLAAIAATAGLAALYRAHVRPWIYHWGARDDELSAPLPGDELIEPGTVHATRALTIEASPHDIWPWLAQIGEDRGGFYSYSLLERAVGADVHNAIAIHPEWQRVRVGDTVWLARRYGQMARQVVASVEPDSHLVLVSPEDYQRLQRHETASGCWSFVLRRGGESTRLLVRSSGGAIGHFWFDIPHFVMEQKMMRGIARRSQRSRREEIAESIARHPSSRHRRAKRVAHG
jgi:hypothetical protein